MICSICICRPTISPTATLTYIFPVACVDDYLAVLSHAADRGERSGQSFYGPQATTAARGDSSPESPARDSPGAASADRGASRSAAGQWNSRWMEKDIIRYLLALRAGSAAEGGGVKTAIAQMPKNEAALRRGRLHATMIRYLSILRPNL